MTEIITLPDLPNDELLVDRPTVARSTRRGRGLIGYGAVLVTGALVLVGMTVQRNGLASDALIPAATARTANFPAPQPLPADVATSTGSGSAVSTRPAVPAPQYAVDNAVAVPMPISETPVAMSMPAAPVAITAEPPSAGHLTRLSAPAMIVDLSDAATAGLAVGKPGNPALDGPAKSAGTGGANEAQFLQSIDGPTATASASRIGRLDQVVAEGTVMSATLETAINSDLPGFARAVVSRNVTSFDGTRLLIPRGSRVIGQYKSGVALGASRVFVIWTRLIRPDGVSIQLMSPGGDDLGRGGLAGKVNSHFLQKFGSSILTSVLNGAVQLGSAALGSSTPVYINTVGQATAAASSAMRTGDIPPTIRTPQGVAVKIFVSRDLDFSTMDKTR